MLEVKYVEMPISIEQKKEYHRQGFRVVDIRFAPECHEDQVKEEKKPRRRRNTAEDEE